MPQIAGDGVEHVLDGVALAGRDVEDAGRRVVAQREVHEGEEVRHVEEIANRVGAEARLPGLEPLVERRDRPDGQPRTGDVGEAQRDNGNRSSASRYCSPAVFEMP